MVTIRKLYKDFESEKDINKQVYTYHREFIKCIAFMRKMNYNQLCKELLGI